MSDTVTSNTATISTGFLWPLRVYWEDTDAGGVVYHARYVHFFERARSEWLRSLGYQQRQLQQELDLVFAIRSMQLEFMRPALMDDELLVSVQVTVAARASLRFQQHIYRQNQTQSHSPTHTPITGQNRALDDGAHGELIASAAVYAACLNASTFRPRRIPQPMLQQVADSQPMTRNIHDR